MNVTRQVERLTTKICDDTADACDYEALRELLADSAEARLTYLAYVDADAELTLVAAELREELTAAANRPRPFRWALPLAVVAAACLAAVWLLPTIADARQRSLRQSPISLTLTTQHASIWAGGQTPLPDQPIDGQIRLLSGMAELRAANGVSIVLRGPAILAPTDRNAVILKHGRIRCNVPLAARGFTVQTPRADVVDLGTDFGVLVGPDGEEEVHVFAGNVRLAAKLSANAESLVTGDARRLDGNGKLHKIALEPQHYPAAAKPAEAYRRALENAYAIGRRDGARVCYTFDDLLRMEGIRSSRVTNLAAYSTARDGHVLGAEPVRGRFAGSTALRFDSRADAVRFTFDADFTQATFLTWIKLDDLAENDFTSLLMTDNWNEAGQVHWQLRSHPDTVQLEYSVYGHKPADFYSEPFDRSLLVGNWAHLATVFDGKTSTIRHYLNGNPIGSSDTGPAWAHIGDGQLGAWAVGTSPTIHRPLAGIMDEFLLIERALTTDEIRALYAAGLPDTE